MEAKVGSTTDKHIGGGTQVCTSVWASQRAGAAKVQVCGLGLGTRTHEQRPGPRRPRDRMGVGVFFMVYMPENVDRKFIASYGILSP